LIKTYKLEGLDVTGLTWGNEGSRDVVYAKEITKRLNWKWKHYTVTAKNLLDNITETAIHGCEYSPIHLHAIPQIRDDNQDLEVILAGSYGDSVGRGEYSGIKVRFIKPIFQNISNVCGIINQSIFNNSLKNIENDIKSYHEQFPEKESYMQNELDYQIHYMRRQLNSCMGLLSGKMEFHQIFTQPYVYGYMWSINPEKRNDLIYKYMFQEFKTKLNDIPWARTGIPYYNKKGKPDPFQKKHHSYVNLIHKVIFKEIKELILSEEINKLGVFNQTNLKFLLKLIKYIPSNNLFYLEKIIWIASIAKMVKIYNIQIIKFEISNPYKTNINWISVLIEYTLRIIRIKISFIKKIKINKLPRSRADEISK